jgi:hypothetical protein
VEEVKKLNKRLLYVQDLDTSKATGIHKTKLTSWSSALLVKLQFVQLLKNFPAFYGT